MRTIQMMVFAFISGARYKRWLLASTVSCALLVGGDRILANTGPVLLVKPVGGNRVLEVSWLPISAKLPDTPHQRLMTWHYGSIKPTSAHVCEVRLRSARKASVEVWRKVVFGWPIDLPEGAFSFWDVTLEGRSAFAASSYLCVLEVDEMSRLSSGAFGAKHPSIVMQGFRDAGTQITGATFLGSRAAGSFELKVTTNSGKVSYFRLVKNSWAACPSAPAQYGETKQ